MNIVVNSKFKPYSFKELIEPLQLYKLGYEEAEKKYLDLATLLGTYKDTVSQEESPTSYNIINEYNKNLTEAIDDFSLGMTISNRRRLFDLLNRFQSEIRPIALAEEAKQKEKAFRRELKAKDSSIVFKDENLTTDKFLHGRTPDESYISGKEITAETAAKSEAISKALFSDPEFNKVLGGQLYQMTIAGGITPQSLNYIINDQLDNNPNLSSELRTKLQSYRQVFEEAMNKVQGWGADALQKVYDSAITGMYAGLAKPTYEYKENKNFVSAMQQMQAVLAQRELEMKEKEFVETQKALKLKTGEIPFYVDPNGTEYRYMGKNIIITSPYETTVTEQVKTDKGYKYRDSKGTIYYDKMSAEERKEKNRKLVSRETNETLIPVMEEPKKAIKYISNIYDPSAQKALEKAAKEAEKNINTITGLYWSGDEDDEPEDFGMITSSSKIQIPYDDPDKIMEAVDLPEKHKNRFLQSLRSRGLTEDLSLYQVLVKDGRYFPTPKKKKASQSASTNSTSTEDSINLETTESDEYGPNDPAYIE